MSEIGLFRFEGAETDDEGDLQLLKGQGYAGEELTGVHRIMPFGLHSHAPKESHSFAIAARGERDLVVALGLEHQKYRPKDREEGSSAIYDMHGNIVSLVEKEMRHVHAKAVVIKAPEIVLEGTVYLGGKDGAKLVHRKGDEDSDGDTAVGSASKVYAL